MTATIANLIAAYRGQEQLPVLYRPATWVRVLAAAGVPEAVTTALTDDRVSERVTAVSADRSVDRATVRRVLHSTDLGDDTDLLRAFLLVQAWGTGTTGNRTIRHTGRAFGSRDLLLGGLRGSATTLRAAVDASALSGAYAGWRAPGVGRSFFTKWFAFAGYVDGRGWQPLILDDRVLATLNNTLGISTRQLAGSPHWPDRYRAYVEHAHRWADESGVPAERVEWVLFKHNGRPLDATT